MANMNGFLLNYSEADMLRKLSDEEFGFIIRACIARQRDFTPFPETDNIAFDMAFSKFEWIISRRLAAQKGGKTNYERNGSKYADNPEHYDFHNHDDT